MKRWRAGRTIAGIFGQSMIETGIIVALLCLPTIAVITLLPGRLDDAFRQTYFTLADSSIEDSMGLSKKFEAVDGADVKVNGRVLSFTHASAQQGVSLDTSGLQVGKTYRLTYKFKKAAGTLRTMGGTASATAQGSFLIDNAASQTGYSATEGTNVDDTAEEHAASYTFTYTGGEGDRGLCIQPNLGSDTSATVDVWDVWLEEA